MTDNNTIVMNALRAYETEWAAAGLMDTGFTVTVHSIDVTVIPKLNGQGLLYFDATDEDYCADKEHDQHDI